MVEIRKYGKLFLNITMATFCIFTVNSFANESVNSLDFYWDQGSKEFLKFNASSFCEDFIQVPKTKESFLLEKKSTALALNKFGGTEKFWKDVEAKEHELEETELYEHSCCFGEKCKKYFKVSFKKSNEARNLFFLNTPSERRYLLSSGEGGVVKASICEKVLTGFERDPKTYAKGDSTGKKFFKKHDEVEILSFNSIDRNPGWGSRELEFVKVKDSIGKKYWMALEFLTVGAKCEDEGSEAVDVSFDYNKFANKNAFVCEKVLTGFKGTPKKNAKGRKFFKRNEKLKVLKKKSIYANPGWGEREFIRVSSKSGEAFWMALESLSIGSGCDAEEAPEDKVEELPPVIINKVFENIYPGVKSFFNTRIIDGVPITHDYQGKYICANQFISGFRSKSYIGIKRQRNKLKAGVKVKILQGQGNKLTVKGVKYIKVEYKGKNYWVNPNSIKSYQSCPKINKDLKVICKGDVNHRGVDLNLRRAKFKSNTKVYRRRDHKYEKQEKLSYGKISTFVPVSKKGDSSNKVYWVKESVLKRRCQNHSSKVSKDLANTTTSTCNGWYYQKHSGDHYPMVNIPGVNFLKDSVAKFSALRLSTTRYAVKCTKPSSIRNRKICMKSGNKHHAATDLYSVKREQRSAQRKSCRSWYDEKAERKKCREKYSSSSKQKTCFKQRKCKERRVYAINDGVVSYFGGFFKGTHYILVKSKGGYTWNYAELHWHKNLKPGSIIKRGDFIGVAKKGNGLGYRYPAMLHLEKYTMWLNSHRATRLQRKSVKYQTRERDRTRERNKYARHYSISGSVACHARDLFKDKFGVSINKVRP